MDGTNLYRSCIFLFCLSAILSGCGTPLTSPKATNNTNYTPPGYGGTGNSFLPPTSNGPDDSLGFAVADATSPTLPTVVHKADATYDQNKAGAPDAGVTGFSDRCQVLQADAGTAAADILCIMEIPELDLYFNKLTLQYQVPTDMCTYFRMMPYHFYEFEPGNGPATVSWEEQADGTYTNPVNSANGVAVCSYKYAGDNVNCCIGPYTQAETNSDGTTVITQEKWGGSVVNCLTGPAMQTQPKDNAGLPMSSVYYVENTGLNQNYEINAAIGLFNLAGYQMSSSVWAANWYRGSEHTNNKPIATRIPANVTDATSQYNPEETYKLECLDRAQEIQARIRLMIRKWSRAPIEEGDPNGYMQAAGADPIFGPDYNNHLDWTDFGETYPASSL